MKSYNAKNEVTIYSDEVADKEQKNKAKDGDMIDHYQQVRNISFYAPLHDGTYTKVFIERSFIFDLAEQIESIERVKTKDRFTDLPF